MNIDGQLELWDTISVGQDEVKIDGALNVHAEGEIKPFEVTLTTGDLTLIVAMIEDYIKGLDVIKESDILWQAYYRNKFKGISEKIQKQIDYDYEKALKKCQKKTEKESNSNVGEEAMALMIKKRAEKSKVKRK